MKAVMISIQPQWCEKIAIREKTLEVRKTRPKLETPFKCYIYQTKHKWWYELLEKLSSFKWVRAIMEGQGKVIGEFVCDDIRCFDVPYPAYQNKLDKQILELSCCTYYQLHRYAYHDKLYGWHISDLVIYDKPKELSEFTPDCRFKMDDMLQCDYRKVACNCQAFDYNPWPDGSVNAVTCKRRMKRPPQSWCYVEEEQNAES